MKTLIKFISKILVISAILGATTHASELKIGVVNAGELESCLYAKDIQKKLEKEFSPKKDKFDAKQKELNSKGELLQRDQAILSEKERSTKERELAKLQQEIQHMMESLDVEIKSRHQEELSAFKKAVDHAVNKLAKDEHYDLILLDQGVIFSKEALNCTSQVVGVLDHNFKAKK